MLVSKKLQAAFERARRRSATPRSAPREDQSPNQMPVGAGQDPANTNNDEVIQDILDGASQPSLPAAVVQHSQASSSSSSSSQHQNDFATVGASDTNARRTSIFLSTDPTTQVAHAPPQTPTTLNPGETRPIYNSTHTTAVQTQFALLKHYKLSHIDMTNARRLYDMVKNSLNSAYQASIEECKVAANFTTLVEGRLLDHIALFVSPDPMKAVPHSTGEELNAMFKLLDRKIRKHRADATMDPEIVESNFVKALKEYPIKADGAADNVQEAQALMHCVSCVLHEANLIEPLTQDFERNNNKGGSDLSVKVWKLIMKQLPKRIQDQLDHRIQLRAAKANGKIKDFQSPVPQRTSTLSQPFFLGILFSSLEWGMVE